MMMTLMMMKLTAAVRAAMGVSVLGHVGQLGQLWGGAGASGQGFPSSPGMPGQLLHFPQQQLR